MKIFTYISGLIIFGYITMVKHFLPKGKWRCKLPKDYVIELELKEEGGPYIGVFSSNWITNSKK